MTCPSIFALAQAMAAAQDPELHKSAVHKPERDAASSSEAVPVDTVSAQAERAPPPGLLVMTNVWIWLLVIAGCVAVSVGGHALVVWIEGVFGLKAPDVRQLIDGKLFVVLLLLYVVLLSLPFVPGAEIGIGLLLVFGAEAALPVYGATVVALLVSFLVGRLVPLPRLIAAANGSGMVRLADVLASGVPTLPRASDAVSPVDWSGTIVARLLHHRYIALGILLNTPGNALLGGGGGIALAAGASRLLSFPAFLGTVLVAVAPVPAAILIASLVTTNG